MTSQDHLSVLDVVSGLVPRADQVQKVLHQPIWCSDCGTTTRSSSPKPCPRQSLSRQNGSIDTYRPTTLENSPTIVSSQGAKSVYSWGSSLVHGYKWAVDYAGGMRWFGMIADSLAAAINMTECAVALYEAVSRAPEGERESVESYVPARLEPTIAQWTGLISSSRRCRTRALSASSVCPARRTSTYSDLATLLSGNVEGRTRASDCRAGDCVRAVLTQFSCCRRVLPPAVQQLEWRGTSWLRSVYLSELDLAAGMVDDA